MADATTATMSTVRETRIVAAVQTYGRRLMGFIRGRVRGQDDAEDLMQDVWLQLSRVGDLDQIEELGAWLYKVARSKIIDQKRKRKAESVSSLKLEGNDDNSLDDILFVEQNTPETETLRELMWEEFWIALDELPPEQKDVFVWNEFDDLTFDEIAKRTGENPKTLISRKRYAVQKLRKRLAVMRDDYLQD